MTTAPVVSITDELLADLEAKAQQAQMARCGHGWHDDESCSWWTGDSREGALMSAASPATILALTAHIRSLTERLEKTEKDAGRYRWLRDQCSTLGRLTIARCTEFEIYGWSGDDPDRAIDAAIAQEADHE